MKKTWLVVVALVVVALAGVVGWLVRSQTTVWEVSPPSLQSLLDVLEPSVLARPSGQTTFPWDSPDLVLRWADPWGDPSRDPFVRPVSGAPPREILAFEVFGLLSARGTALPADFSSWVATLDQRVAGRAPLAVAARSDAELLSLLLWFGDGVLGPEALQTSLASLAEDPASSVDPSGALPDSHPWAAVVEELRRWSASGRLIAQWWDLSDADVVAAVAEGRAQWGLGWSGSHFAASQEGVPLTLQRLSPAWPGRRSTSLMGRWLLLENRPGWGDPARVSEARHAFGSPSVGQAWLAQGLLLADPDLPAVNQETKALGTGLHSAGTLISAPPTTSDLSRWRPLLEAIRTALRE